jgi:hypothetical protein
MVGDAGEGASEPCPGVDVVQLRRGDERDHGRGPLAAAVTAREQPGLSAESDAAEHAFGGVVGQANPAVVEEPGERRPALEGVVQRLGEVVVTRQPSPGLEHPGVEVGDERGHDGLAVLQADGCRTPVHLPLGVEHPIDAPHRLSGEWRASDLGEFERLPAEVMAWTAPAQPRSCG